MTIQTLYTDLETFVDAVSSGEEDIERDSIKSFITNKTKMTIEAFNGNKITLDGDSVLIAGKKIGAITQNDDEGKSPIHFESDNGEHKGKFDSLDDLYSFVSERFNVKESAINEMDDCGDCPECKEKGTMKDGKCSKCAYEMTNEGMADVSPAVNKQSVGSSERSARMAKKVKQSPDGKPGSYEGGSDVNMSKGAAYPGGENDLKTKGGYDKHDPRKNHKDKIKDKNGPADKADASDLNTDGNYDAHDVRKEHSKNAQK